MRHLTSEERLSLKDILDKAGFAEVLRFIGGYVLVNALDLEEGERLKSELLKLAKECGKLDFI